MPRTAQQLVAAIVHTLAGLAHHDASRTCAAGQRLLRVGLAVVGLVCVTGCPPQSKTNPAVSPQKSQDATAVVGTKAPPLGVVEWLPSKPDLQGKMLMVDIWATWCPPCRRAIPEFNNWYAKYKDRLVIVGITNEDITEVRQMTEPKIDYFVGLDPQGRLGRSLQLKAIPYVLLIDPSGIVRWQGVPGQPGQELTEQVLEEMLNKYVPQS